MSDVKWLALPVIIFTAVAILKATRVAPAFSALSLTSSST